MKRILALAAIVLLITATETTVARGATAAPGGVATAAPRTMAVAGAAAFVAGHPAGVHASSNDAFVQHAVISTREGVQYVAYDRTYKGLPVVGGDFVVVTDAQGKVLTVAVAQDQVIDVTITPKLTKAQAAAIASRQLTAVTQVESNRLVVRALGAPRLAYDTLVAGTRGKSTSRLHVFTDAQTGTVFATDDLVKDGTGNAAINGPNPVNLRTGGSAPVFSMSDPTRPGISCRNFSTKAVLVGTDDVWGNGNGANIETGCVDALFDIQREWSMLKSWLGRDGFDGAGRGFPVKVGLNDLNAFWNGSSVSIGHNQAGHWISALDVVGHEYGHSIDTNTPGGQSGNGVSEATGDIFGALTEWFANEPAAFDPPDFKVGEEVNLVGKGPIRFMYHPSLAGDPNCYSPAVPNMETHSAAGPFNHWFYLTAMGNHPTNGQPSSPTCNGSNVTGLGIQTAGKIFYHAMLTKTSGMTYLKYRTATLNAAKHLTPGNCTDFKTVKAAWNAVSVPAQAADPACP
ncbi:MAG: peptidase M4 family protein [Pseudonocardiales bacterium]|nr:MAG: peptidase M4 family protein [Pseudonocardiales bacterium]